MNYGVILAGGSGLRIKSTPTPKQFLKIGKKIILQLTIDKFLLCKKIDKIIIAAPSAWIGHTKDILAGESYSDIDICAGGKTRQESLYNALQHIRDTYGMSDIDIAVSHDAARPFVSLRIIEDNIDACLQYGAVDTVIPATDTIVVSKEGKWLNAIPARNDMYQGQTPQSFFINKFLNIYASLSSEYLVEMTDAARILIENGVPVALVQGEEFNIKITTDYDLQLANYILNGFKND